MDYKEEDFEKLEQDERKHTDALIASMILILQQSKGDLEKELRIFYQKYGSDGIVTIKEAKKWVGESDHRKRLTVLLLFISNLFDDNLTKLTPTFEDLAKGVISKEADFFNVKLDLDKLSKATWGADGLNWSDRLEDDVVLWKYHVMKDLKQSIYKNENIDTVLEKMDKRFSTMGKVITALGTTESTAIGSIAREAAFKKLKARRYKVFAQIDERTCEQCGGLHNKIFPISAYEVGVTASPFHTRCRCWEVPVD